MFEGMDEREFYDRFRTEDKCKEFLYTLKWKSGFSCKRCGCRDHWYGRTRFHARCKKCGYDESLTANTIFHKMHIPLLKAFPIVFHVSVYKKGSSVLNLSKLVNVSQKSVWLIKRKIQEAMGATDPADAGQNEKVKVRKADGVILTHRPDEMNGLQGANLVICEVTKGKGRKRFLKSVKIASSSIKTDCHLEAGRYVEEGKDILIWNFRNWLSGIHHHCADKYLKGYMDEFKFRFNHRFEEKRIWYILMEKLIKAKPYFHNRHAAKG